MKTALMIMLASSVVAAQPAPSDVDPGAVDDALAPGAFVAPTALTEPAGTLSASLSFGADTKFNDSVLTSVSASAAITNQISVSATALGPTEDYLRLYVLSAKAQVVRYERLRLALQGNVLFDGSGDYAGVVGGAGSLCLDDACNSYASAYLGVGLVHDSGSSGVPFAVSGSVVAQVVPHLKIVAEALTGFSSADVGGVSDGVIGFLGARVSNQSLGVNLGLAHPFGLGDNEPTLIFASLTGRVFTR